MLESDAGHSSSLAHLIDEGPDQKVSWPQNDCQQVSVHQPEFATRADPETLQQSCQTLLAGLPVHAKPPRVCRSLREF